jgi:hypothetical protein
MKKMKKKLNILAFIFIATLTSCDNNDTLQNESFDENTLYKEIILGKNLDSRYDIPKDVYNEFIDNLIFDEKGNVVGAIYDKIENQLDDNSSNEFWNNFGFEIRKSDIIIKEESNNNSNVQLDNPSIFTGYKPKRGGCKANDRWICVIREY